MYYINSVKYIDRIYTVMKQNEKMRISCCHCFLIVTASYILLQVIVVPWASRVCEQSMNHISLHIKYFGSQKPG